MSHNRSIRRFTPQVSDGRRKKTLILDPKMQGPLMMVADKKMLSEKGVEKTQVLQPGAVECDSKDVVYIVRPSTVVAQCREWTDTATWAAVQTRPSQEAMLMIVDNLRHFKKKKIQKDVSAPKERLGAGGASPASG